MIFDWARRDGEAKWLKVAQKSSTKLTSIKLISDCSQLRRFSGLMYQKVQLNSNGLLGVIVSTGAEWFDFSRWFVIAANGWDWLDELVIDLIVKLNVKNQKENCVTSRINIYFISDIESNRLTSKNKIIFIISWWSSISMIHRIENFQWNEVEIQIFPLVEIFF